MSDVSEGLSDLKLLRKADKLRELGVGAIIPLPQLVVVGDQSSGKSSVLESLTGFSFPRDTGLCTRYATQITCRRDDQKSVEISVIPRPDASDAWRGRLELFRRFVDGGEQDQDFAKIFEEASRVMGIRSTATNSLNDSSLTTFSEDILKIEISGPEQNHLTVIDVPGIFRAATPGLTTEDDIVLVDQMVKRYIHDSRTIILAVIPANVDVATQEVLKLAKDADPEGVRTMGVLTKPDLAIERATQQDVMDLILGKRNDLRLGYCIVKNRSADDKDSSLADRQHQEDAFFRRDPWTKVAGTGRVGVLSLKKRLRDLLMDITRQEIPKVKVDVKKRLSDCNQQLEALGPARSDSSAQRLYLTRLSTEFQKMTECALNANYVGQEIFTERKDMRLITRIVSLNNSFSDYFAVYGHKWKFNHGSVEPSEGDDSEDEDDAPEDDESDASDWIPGKVRPPKARDVHDEIDDLIETVPYIAPRPIKTGIMRYIGDVYSSSRGPELGTFGGSILAIVFVEQSKHWNGLVRDHVSAVIVLVHDFISNLMEVCVPDASVRKELWDSIFLDEIRKTYKAAMDQTTFLLGIERHGVPMTTNHYFNSNLQGARLDRLRQQLLNLTVGKNGHERYVTADEIRKFVKDKSNTDQVKEDIHDILQSYYKVARKRFVDVICQQVIGHLLLYGKDSPLKIFCPDRMAQLSDAQLEAIAGERPDTKMSRERLTAAGKRLEQAMRVLKE